MRKIFFGCFLLISMACKSQQYVLKDFSDSMRNVDKGHIGKSFPDFNVTDMDGKYFSDSLLNGKITLINFWFKSCRPCIAEFKRLNEIFEKFRNNKLFNFISFTFEDTSAIKGIVKTYSLKFPVISISEVECHRLNFGAGFPTNIFVDKYGKIAFFKSGGALEVSNASQEIDSTILPKLYELLN